MCSLVRPTLRDALALCLLVVAGCGNPQPPAPHATVDMGPAALPLGITDVALAAATAGAHYVATLTATGTHAPEARWTIDGVPPPGMALAETQGASVNLSGTPTTTGSYNFTVIVADSEGESARGELTLTVGNALTIDGELPGGVAGQPYSATLTAAGGHDGSFAWSATQGPSGLTVSGSGRSATVSAASLPAGSFMLVVSVQDSAGDRAVRSYGVTVESVPLISVANVPTAEVGQPFSVDLGVSGTNGAVQWTISGNAPPGLILQAATTSTPQLQGTPMAAGSYSFSVAVSDTTGGTATAAVTVVVTPALAIATPQLAGGNIGASYSATIAGLGGLTPTAYQWQLYGGSLPPGLTLASTGSPSTTLSGTPSAVGQYSFTLQLTDGSEMVKQSYDISIGNNPPTLSSATLPGATFGQGYTATISGQSHAGGAVKWTLLTGTLPPGLSLSSSTQPTVTLAGTPVQCGSFSFTLQMADAGGSATAVFTLLVARQTRLEVDAAVLTTARVNAAYATELVTRDAQGAVAWTLAAGALPPGLTLVADGTRGRLAGTPTQAGWYPFTVQAADGGGQTATQRFGLRVAPAGLWAAAAHASTNSTTTTTTTVTVHDVSGGNLGAETDLGVMQGVSASPQFAPQGDWLTVTNQATALSLADLRAQPQPLALLANVTVSSVGPNWSPDGKRFLFGTPTLPSSSVYPQLDVVDLSGAAPVTTSLSPASDGPGLWSPDGSAVAYWSGNGTELHVWDGSQNRVAFSNSNYNQGGIDDVWWTPDSSALVFRNVQLFYVDLTSPGAPPIALTTSGTVSEAAQSPDGGRLFFEATTSDGTSGSIQVVDLGTRQLGQPMALSRTEAFSTNVIGTWAVDSQHLLIEDLGNSTVRYWTVARDAIGSADPVAAVLPPTGTITSTAAWTADGAHLAWTNAGSLYEVDLASGVSVDISHGNVNAEVSPFADRRAFLYTPVSAFGWFLVDESAATPTPMSLVATYGFLVHSPALDSVAWADQQSSSASIYCLNIGATPATLFSFSGDTISGLALSQ